MFRNFSLGAHIATVERPPTMPAVYHAALTRRGPPSTVRGATTAPITPEIRVSIYYQREKCDFKCTILMYIYLIFSNMVTKSFPFI
jgi:hypothetical protein